MVKCGLVNASKISEIGKLAIAIGLVSENTFKGRSGFKTSGKLEALVVQIYFIGKVSISKNSTFGQLQIYWMNRLEQLQEFYDEDPLDPFNLYGLALEISKSDRQQGHTLFQQLISGFPDYVPAYYQSAVLSIELAKPTIAKDTLEKGMAWAKSKNDIKAFHELQQLWNEVEGEI